MLTPDVLRELAGDKAYARGLAYFNDGHVGQLEAQGERIFAPVYGSEAYETALWADGDGLAFSCTCPVGDNAEFCKHCVAVGLAWAKGGGKARRLSVRGAALAAVPTTRAISRSGSPDKTRTGSSHC